MLLCFLGFLKLLKEVKTICDDTNMYVENKKFAVLGCWKYSRLNYKHLIITLIVNYVINNTAIYYKIQFFIQNQTCPFFVSQNKDIFFFRKNNVNELNRELFLEFYRRRIKAKKCFEEKFKWFGYWNN